ncbi:MAG: preprotein translocase subunit SecG [Pseudomonadota bacterium]|jgi:preprotein translocase subunit SecG|nr:preprotein translocase subunit SecG [Porticoccaceae bacterium]MCH2560895.1 preprotein translocase subunit SecG [Pseudomonadales bacterium]MEC7158367.1 preprotein translocase subunit SecG [Pseudomonadota bacterium]MAL68720.1 preprotein translocase subunit SecG [Porticoccaceae bacterium]MAN53597.1 preprotein translocase subunit SecG [Porticoccaceae bacterium]|tara:strand:+ start:719 stop:1078 length:360 start_codon:yes stop_codon:yes gene_type:complete
MENIILIIHFIIAILIIGFVLIQQGKGAEAGASFGAGASQTVFGSSGSWNFFSKITAVLATLFFVTSVTLAVYAKNKVVVETIELPQAPESALEILESSSDLPQAIGTGEEEATSDLPQ